MKFDLVCGTLFLLLFFMFFLISLPILLIFPSIPNNSVLALLIPASISLVLAFIVQHKLCQNISDSLVMVKEP